MKVVVAILVTFCLSSFQDASAEIKVFQKSHVDLTKRLVFDFTSYTDGQLTYALCDKENPRAQEIKCTVIREKKPYGDESYSCDVTFKRSEKHSVEYSPHVKVIPFGNINVALTLVEVKDHDIDSHLNFTTVQMESCKIGQATIDTKAPINVRDFTVIGHSDYYDVFYKNNEVLCDGKVCKATIDANGKLVDGPRPSIEKNCINDWLINPIPTLDDNTSKHDYLYFVNDGEDLIYKMLKADGTVKLLANYTDLKSIALPAINNKLIGVCYQNDKEYKCQQFDFNGNSKLQTTLPDHADNMLIFEIYNLPDGGFYLVHTAINDNLFAEHLIERIDSNGKRAGTFKFQGLGKHKRNDYMLYPSFYQNENKETCVSSLAYDSGDTSGPEEGKGHIYLTANCFTDADFSK